MTYIDARCRDQSPAEKAQILVLASGDREKGAAAEPVFTAISADAVVWRGGQGDRNGWSSTPG